VEALPFADASFDVVIAVTVLCFVEDRTLAFAELARVLRPGGRLVLGELGGRSVWAAWRRMRGWLGSTTWRAARFWTRAELRRELTRAGFGVVSMRGAVHYPPSARWARALAPLDARLTKVGAPGAAFLVAVADKPRTSREPASATRRA
jgi:SAM-dependent methyltransferase